MSINRTIQSTILENGVTVVTDHAPHFQSVAIALAVQVGSAHECEEQSGIAHALEHLVFRGSRSRSGDELQKAFALSGGYLNAQTDEDSTIYQGITLAADLGDAVELLAEMIREPRLNADDLELEKGIIQQESCRGCFGCSMRDNMFDQAYPDQPLRHPVIGFEDTVSELTRDDLIAFHHHSYVGQNITLAVSGDVDHDALVEIARKSLGVIRAGEPIAQPKLSYSPGEMHLGNSSEQGAIRFIFPMTSFDQPMRRAARLFYDILGGHGQSRLMSELREKRGLVYNTWADGCRVAGQELIIVEAVGEARKMPQISQVMIDTICALARTPDRHEFELAKTRIHAGFHMNLDNLTGRVTDLIEDIHQLGTLSDYAERYAGYQAITLEDMQAAGAALLSTSPTIISAGPARGKPKFSELRARLRGHDAVVQPLHTDLRLVS